MSVSENSTLSPSVRDNEVSDQLLDGHVYGLGELAVKPYKKSPYAEPDITSLEVGPRQAKYLIHRALLSQSAGLESKITAEEGNETISLPELDENAAHTLVHYLYTRKYESLEAYELRNERSLPEYKHSVCVYCAATRYNIPGLVELAKERITSFSKDLTIFDILSVARGDAFPCLLDEESWFPEHIEKAIKGAVSQDPHLFTRPAFVDQIQGDFKYRQVVMRAIVSTYFQKPADLSEQPTGLSTPVPSLADVSEPEVLDLDPIEPLEIENEEHQVVGVEPAEEAVTIPDYIKEDAIDSEKIEPQTESLEAPESFTDEVGFGSSKTYQRLGKKNENEDPETITDSEAPIPIHKRSDSVIQIMEDASTDSLPVVDEKAVAEPEPTHAVPVVMDEASTDAKAPKKKNRNKKKKAPVATVATTDN